MTRVTVMMTPPAHGAYKLAQALARELGVDSVQTTREAWENEYKRLQRVAARRGVDVKAWLKARTQPRAVKTPDTHGPAPRPPQVFE